MTSHVFHSWSAQAHVRQLQVTAAAGSFFFDADGTRYLDLSSQLVNLNLGHQRPEVVAAIVEQARRLCTIGPNLGSDVREELAARIAAVAPGDLNRVLFTNGGAEANEHAVRMARLHTGRHKILSAYRSYHGATAMAISLTGDPRRWPTDQAGNGVVHFFGPHPYRSSFWARTVAEECERALAHLEQVIMFEGAATIAAVVMETVVGTNGILVPPDGYLTGVRELCSRHGILLVADEVMCGFGRVGEWFAVDAWQVVPDLITFAKGVNSGYVPLGGVIVSDAVAATFADRAYPGGLTYSGHPLACAAGVASMRVIEEEQILPRVRDLGERVVAPELAKLRDRHPSVGDVRGRGLFWAVELVKDRRTREPLVPFNATGDENEPMTEFAAACRRHGVWPFVNMNRTHVTPPLTISEEELHVGFAALDAALDVADRHTT